MGHNSDPRLRMHQHVIQSQGCPRCEASPCLGYPVVPWLLSVLDLKGAPSKHRLFFLRFSFFLTPPPGPLPGMITRHRFLPNLWISRLLESIDMDPRFFALGADYPIVELALFARNLERPGPWRK